MNTDRGDGVGGSDSDVPSVVDGSGTGAVLVSTASRRLRQELRPLAWMVLEEIALDAVSQDGRLIALTSARRLVAGLGIDPGTAAGALRALRDKGLLVLERESGLAGRFGLSAYVIESVDGLTILTPGGGMPRMEETHVDQPRMARPDTVAAVGPQCTTALTAASGTPAVPAVPDGQAQHRGVIRQAVGQGALDLDLGSA